MALICWLSSYVVMKWKELNSLVILFIFWHSNPNSITRINDCQYSYDQSFVGYTENMIWAIKEGEKRNPFNGAILYEKVAIMFNLYEYYIETVARDEIYRTKLG